MKKLRFVVSLTTNDNDYQMEQAADAQASAKRMAVDVETIYAGNDAIGQSQQLLKIIQASPELRPSGIIVEPAGGTALPQVARAAAAAGIAWVILNRDAEYMASLRKTYSVPVFGVTSDHEEIGRIQGQQFAALLPQGGSVLHIQGPSESLAAKQRTSGMQTTKPSNIQVKALKGQWTEASSYQAVTSWLRLSTSQKSQIDVIAAQDDSMAIGARKAFQELPNDIRERWLKLPYLGCDGLPKGGQAWVHNGVLVATVIVPANSGQAVEMLAQAIHGGTMPPEVTLTVPRSFPAIEELTSAQAKKTRSFSAGSR
jgi:ribose transport system substrate-binding protein